METAKSGNVLNNVPSKSNKINFFEEKSITLKFRLWVYKTPLELGTPLTRREGEIAIPTARAKALKIASKQ